METTSRGRSPRATSPRAAWRTRSPYSRHVMALQTPSVFSRMATCSPRSRTTLRKRRGRVSSPRTVNDAAGAGRGGVCVATFMSGPPSSSPHLLALPAAGAADARVLDAEVELLDVVLLEQARACVLHHDAPHLQHVAVVSEVEGHVSVLLHEEDGHALLAVDAADDVEDVLDELRGEPQRRLVEEHHGGPGHEGTADGEHLLLAAGERARALLGAASEHGEVVVHHLEVAGDAFPVLPRVRAHLEVLAHGEEGKDLAPLRHVAEPQAHDAVGIHAAEEAAVERNCALLSVHYARHRLEDGGLARPVGAEDGHDSAARHREAHPADGHDGAVVRLDVVDLEEAIRPHVSHRGRPSPLRDAPALHAPCPG